MKNKNIIILVALVISFILLLFLVKRRYECFNTKNILFVMPNVKKDIESEYNGDLIRNGGVGASGTHQSSIIVAEGLAKKGHSVTFYDSNVKPGTNIGVKYINSKDDIDYEKTDVLIALSQEEHRFPKEFKDLKKLIIFFQTVELRNIEDIYKNIKAKSREYVFVSQWAKNANKSKEGHVIYNAVMDDMLPEVVEKPDNSFIWNASWERGGEVAKKVSENLGGNFILMTYTQKDKSYDKKDIFENMNKSKYFVYPLVLPSAHVHKDTFGCCVSESLCMGVHVITWPIACMPELYGEEGKGCHFIKIPDNFNKELLENYDFISEPNLLSEQAIELITDTVKSIGDQKVDVDYWRNKFNSSKIIDQWDKII